MNDGCRDDIITFVLHSYVVLYSMGFKDGFFIFELECFDGELSIVSCLVPEDQ